MTSIIDSSSFTYRGRAGGECPSKRGVDQGLLLDLARLEHERPECLEEADLKRRKRGVLCKESGSQVNRERYDLATWKFEVGHSLDHVFVMAFEWIHGRELRHSEGVALGTLISAYLYDWGFAEAKALFDACHVYYRPRQIGCTRAEVVQVLGRINELNDLLGLPQNWFHCRQLEDAAFQRMMTAIESS